MGVLRSGAAAQVPLAERLQGQHGSGGLTSWESGMQGSGLFSSFKNAFAAGKNFLSKHPALVQAVKSGIEGFKDGGIAGAVRGAVQGAASKSEALRRLMGGDKQQPEAAA
jgi:hypothetical protein